MLGVPVSPFGWRQQLIVPRILRRVQAAVYHSPYYLMSYFPGAPAVVTIYDLIPQHFPQYVSRRARLLFQVATRLALRAADHVITISEATRKDLLDAFRIPPERVTAIPLAPAPGFAPQPETELSRVRAKYGLSEYALYVGINKPHKNLAALLEAWRQIETDARLVIAGAWDDRYPEPKVRAAQLGLGERVRFLGPVEEEDLPALYSAARLFVFPSRYEGFGLPVIEAMACGTAVACANIASLPEVTGGGAALFDPGDAGQMAAVIGNLLNDPGQLEFLRARAVEQARRFSWRRTAGATLKIYRTLA